MLQHPNDPIRRAAEAVEPALRAQLVKLWTSGFTNPEAIKGILSQAWRGGFQCTAGDIKKDMVSFAFDRLAPTTEFAAAEFAGQFVRELEDDQRVTVNTITLDAIRRGLGPEEMARDVKTAVGLTASQARAVLNYRRALETGSRKALDYRLRDKRFDPTTKKAVLSGAALSPAQIDANVERYRTRYLAFRATTIARYETLFASNAGAYAAAQDLSAESIKSWMIAQDERTCPRCRSIVDLQPDGVPLNGYFEWRHAGKSGRILHPPLHPDCRCTISFGVR